MVESREEDLEFGYFLTFQVQLSHILVWSWMTFGKLGSQLTPIYPGDKVSWFMTRQDFWMSLILIDSWLPQTNLELRPLAFNGSVAQSCGPV